MRSITNMYIAIHLLCSCVAKGDGAESDLNAQQWLQAVRMITEQGQQDQAIDKIESVSPILARASQEEEERLVEFVKENPNIDFTVYLIPASGLCREDCHGRTMLICALASNYTNLLSELEHQDQVVSRYDYQPGINDNLLFRAMAWQAYDAMEQVVRIRPDLMSATVMGDPFILSVPSMGNRDVLKRLLDTGVDVNAYRGMHGQTLLDVISRDSIWFDLVRRYGGRAGRMRNNNLPQQFRKHKVQECANRAARIDLGRIVFPNGRSVVLPGHDMAGNTPADIPTVQWQKLSEASEHVLEQEMTALGEECGGVVIFRCGAGGAYHLRPHIEPILNRVNLMGIYLLQDGTGSPYVRPRDFCPYLTPENGNASVHGTAPSAPQGRSSAEETALRAEWNYREGVISWDAYAEQLRGLGFVALTNSQLLNTTLPIDTQ